MEQYEMIERLDKGEDPLDLSIEKWEDIVNGEGREEGRMNCALCHKHVTIGEGRCSKCLIKIHTGFMGCKNTPYIEYTDAVEDGKGEDVLHEIAVREVALLKEIRCKVRGIVDLRAQPIVADLGNWTIRKSSKEGNLYPEYFLVHNDRDLVIRFASGSNGWVNLGKLGENNQFIGGKGLYPTYPT